MSFPKFEPIFKFCFGQRWQKRWQWRWRHRWKFCPETWRGYSQHVYKGIWSLKGVVMAKICSQKHPLAGGTQNICKSGTSKKALFWHISSILAMKGSQLWPLTHLKDKYYGKIELGKKIVKFGAPGTEIWLFKKKNMDRSTDCAVDLKYYTYWQNWDIILASGLNCNQRVFYLN